MFYKFLKTAYSILATYVDRKVRSQKGKVFKRNLTLKLEKDSWNLVLFATEILLHHMLSKKGGNPPPKKEIKPTKYNRKYKMRGKKKKHSEEKIQ